MTKQASAPYPDHSRGQDAVKCLFYSTEPKLCHLQHKNTLPEVLTAAQNYQADFTSIRLQSVSFTLSGTVTVKPPRGSDLSICSGLTGTSTSAACRLFCLTHAWDWLSSATERCVVVSAAPLCGACGPLFMAVGTRLAPTWFVTLWMLQSRC